jgi:hypothetical protein
MAIAWKTVWQRSRRAFRCLRIFVWLALLLALCGFIYLNQVGLPGFLKGQLQAELRAHGLEVDFQRVRLRWFRGVVGEQVALGYAAQRRGPRLTIGEATLHLDNAALRRLDFQVDAIQIEKGELVWSLFQSNQPMRQLRVDKVAGEVRLLPGDRWELERLHAETLGARLDVSGTLSNASELGKRRTKPSEEARRALEARVCQLLDAVGQVHFVGTPAIDFVINGDARPGGILLAQIKLGASRAKTPWGEWRKVVLTGKAEQVNDTNGVFKADLNLTVDRFAGDWAAATNARIKVALITSLTNTPLWEATWQATLDGLKTRWGEGHAVRLAGHTRQPSPSSSELRSTLTLKAAPVKTGWGEAGDVQLTGDLAGSITKKSIFTGDWKLMLTEPHTHWGRARSAMLEGKLAARPLDFSRQADPSWARWAGLEPFQVDWNCTLQGVASSNLAVESFTSQGRWSAPELKVEKFHAELYRGAFDASAKLNVATRKLEAGGEFDFDVQQLAPQLPEEAQRFISQFTWAEPPKAKGAASIILPVWTDDAPDRWSEALSTLVVSGDAACGAGAFRGVTGTSGSADIAFSNSTWRVTHLRAFRPEGGVDLNYTGNERTRDFQWSGRAQIDPKALRLLLEDENQRRALDDFQFAVPPVIEGEISGRWQEPGTTRLDVRVAMTNFTFRGETCSVLNAGVQFANRRFQFADIDIRRGEQVITTPTAGIDLDTQRLWFTNLHSTMDPLVATKVIGQETMEAIEPYRFATPPTVRAWGAVPLGNVDETDLHFESIEGGPFQWQKFNLPQISGGAHWVTNRLLLTNVQGAFYGGQIRGDALFDFARGEGADFQFHAFATNANLHALMSHLSSPSNKLEGVFDGVLAVLAANTLDHQSWFGSGQVKLRDGLLWDIPLFGIFSPVLNTIAPGLGSSRANEATATFTLANSVLRTEDLEIRSTPVRLHYDGTVSFTGAVNATVEADLLRDTWVFGPLVNLVTKPLTKLFIYKVTGTLNQPKSEPLLIPKFLTFPLHPFKTLKGIFAPEPPSQDSPPEKKKDAEKRP